MVELNADASVRQGAAVPIIDLSKVQPGDVVLETGLAQIATADGGRYGHASLFVTKTLRVQAGKPRGVRIVNDRVQTWRCDGGVVTGVAVEGDVRVLRAAKPPTEALLFARTLAELGARYVHPSELQTLPGLDEEAKTFLGDMALRKAQPPPEAWPGQYCSRVVADILELKSREVTPNGLASITELQDVPNAVLLDGACESSGDHAVTAKVTHLLGAMKQNVIVKAWKQFHRIADDEKAYQPVDPTMDEAAGKAALRAEAFKRFEDLVGTLLTSEIAQLVAIRDVEKDAAL